MLKDVGQKEKLAKELPFQYKQVLSLIPEGLEKPIKVKDIRELTNISSESVRKIIRDLVINYGYVIGACNRKGMKGYFIATNEEEERIALLNLRSRRYEISKRENALLNSIAKRNRLIS